MERNFKVNPIGLKGNEINERMRQLMGMAPINEGISRSTVELTKIGPDGKSYGIVRENHEYYIKVSDKTKNLTVEDFKYIGGLQNKKSEAYSSYAKATKHLNLKFNSICESYDIVNTFNVFVDDNLLSEGAAKEASKHITDTKGKELGSKVKEEGGHNVAEKKVMDEMEEVTLNEYELAIDAMLNETEEEDEDDKNNPYAICTASVGRKDKEKYEACVRKVKKQKAVKETEEEMTDKEKKFAALAEPKDKITYADKIAGATKNKTNEDLSRFSHEELENMSTGEILGNMSAKDFLELLGDAGKDLSRYAMEKIKKGAGIAKDYLEKQYPDVDESMTLEEIQEAIADLKKKTLTEAKKYTLKLSTTAPAAPAAPAPAPAEPIAEPADEAGFGDLGGEEMPTEEMPAEEPTGDMPFDKEPFDAGVEADEDTDPKKFIEQLSGKLGQSLRQYTKDQGQPDFELEKFAINSVISATNSSQMDEEDKDDIIKKLNTAGKDEAEDSMGDTEGGTDLGDESLGGPDVGLDNPDELGVPSDEEPVQEGGFMLDKTKKLSIFAPEGSEEANFKHLSEMREGSNNYMFWQNLKTIVHAASELLKMDCDKVDDLLSDGHGWALDHIATSADDVDEVYHFVDGRLCDWDVDSEEEDYSKWSEPMKLVQPVTVSKDLGYHLNNDIALGESIFRYGSEKFQTLVKEVRQLKDKGLIELNENDQFIVEDYDNGFVVINEGKVKLNTIFEEIEIETINEAEFQGKKVELGKPKRGGSKKFYVYVRNPKTGKVKKVSFGAKAGGGNLAVKLKDPKARKAFADRHNCKSKNDKTKPGYWACRLPRYAKLLGLSGGGTWW